MYSFALGSTVHMAKACRFSIEWDWTKVHIFAPVGCVGGVCVCMWAHLWEQVYWIHFPIGCGKTGFVKTKVTNTLSLFSYCQENQVWRKMISRKGEFQVVHILKEISNSVSTWQAITSMMSVDLHSPQGTQKTSRAVWKVMGPFTTLQYTLPLKWISWQDYKCKILYKTNNFSKELWV